MATIINKYNFTLTPDEQNVINNACANADLDEVYVDNYEPDEDPDYEENIIPFYYNSGDELLQEYAFSLDRNTLQIVNENC